MLKQDLEALLNALEISYYMRYKYIKQFNCYFVYCSITLHILAC